MRAFVRIRSLPVSYRAPLIVALLMIVVSAAISERVLARLSRTQEAFLNGLAGTYLDGLSAAVMPAVLREDVWEVFDALDRSGISYADLSPIETVVTGADGRVLAASDPTRIPSYAELPANYPDRYGANVVTIDEDKLTGYARRDLIYQGQSVGAIHATFDVSHLFAERREILATLLVTNGVLAGLFAFGGFLLVRQAVAPMRILEDHMRHAALGAAEPIADHQFPTRDGEAASLFRRYNALVRSERERANLAIQLAEEEKLASLGRLASGMAHEINNPLGGLFNAIDTLKKHGETDGVRDTSIRLVERGLQGIREIVEAALATYRPERSARPLAPADLEDLRLLLKPELSRRHQQLEWSISWQAPGELALRSGPVRQAVLNLLLNASAATPNGGTICLSATGASERLTVEILDRGPGLTAEAAAILTDRDPGPAVKAGGGLGLWMVRRMVDELGGTVKIAARREGGTAMTLDLPVGGREEQQADAA